MTVRKKDDLVVTTETAMPPQPLDMMHSVTIVEADLDQEAHQLAVLAMTTAYALDPMGNDGPLPESVTAQLIRGLREHPTTLIFLAYADQRPIGIATCFVGFSTFTARPVINIHDLAVLPTFRGNGIGRQLLESVAVKATQLGCSKVTLEVQEHNQRARHLYESAGFAQAVYSPTSGGSLFYTRILKVQ